MSIEVSNTVDIDKSIEAQFDRRMGYLQEDDPVLHIRRISLDYVSQYQVPMDPDDPNNTFMIDRRTIRFSEVETEYCYWYSKYGVPFDNKTGAGGFKNYPADGAGIKIADFNSAEPFDDSYEFCLDQSTFRDLDFFMYAVKDLFYYGITCQPFDMVSVA